MLQTAQNAAQRLSESCGSWRKAALHTGLEWYDLYDLVHRPSTMSRPRMRRVLIGLGVRRPSPYWRPCLSHSLKDEVRAMLEGNPEYTLSDIINCGLAMFERENDD